MDKLGQEWVSAAVDGETDAQTLAELAGDTASHDKWRNYHLIGDAMRGELPSAIPWICPPVLRPLSTRSRRLSHLSPQPRYLWPMSLSVRLPAVLE